MIKSKKEHEKAPKNSITLSGWHENNDYDEFLHRIQHSASPTAAGVQDLVSELKDNGIVRLTSKHRKSNSAS